MSDAPQSKTLREQLAGRWQIPLLLLSGMLLALGVWRMRPHPQPPTFESQFAQAVALKNSELYPEASSYTENLLKDPARTPAEQVRLHRLLAEIIFAHEGKNVIHSEANAKAILANTEQSVESEQKLDSRLCYLRGAALEWLRRPAEAVAEYRQAIDRGAENGWELRKRIIEIRRVMGDITIEQMHAGYDEFLDGQCVHDDLRFWATKQKVELYERQGQHLKAEQLLVSRAADFSKPEFCRRLDYLKALSWYYLSNGKDLNRLDDAERLLRQVLGDVTPANPLYAEAGWLLGRVLAGQERPQYALSFFDDVIAKTVPGPYRVASLLGRAECLAVLKRYEESLEAYNETIRLTTENPYGSLVDLQAVRESTTEMFQVLRTSGQIDEAMRFLKIAAPLAPAANLPLQITYSQQLADTGWQLGSALLREKRDPERARKLLIAAGEEYLRLAKLASTDESASAAATWRAADTFDEAGQRRRTAEVLDTFLHERIDNPRAPEALWRLGQTCEALSQYDKAIATYQRHLTDFPRSISAERSLIALANCFIVTGEMKKAEQTLLRIVDRRPNDLLIPVEPQAGAYKEALLLLGDLYTRAQEYEKAITRFEEVLRRFPNDPRNAALTFRLADAYRQSAVRIREDLADTRNIAFKDDLRVRHQQRLQMARQLYEKVIAAYRAAAADTMSELEQTYLKLAHLYRADCVYDLSYVMELVNINPFAESLEMYDQAAWLYQYDPIAMSAYVQMMNCQLRLGENEKARMTLHRARWALGNISDESFVTSTPDEDRKYWESYLAWLEKLPTFAFESAQADVGS